MKTWLVANIVRKKRLYIKCIYSQIVYTALFVVWIC